MDYEQAHGTEELSPADQLAVDQKADTDIRT
jgi:hypothetical protein